MAKQTPVFVNEFHYMNFGIDVHEGVEIAGPAGTNLKGWSIHFYHSNGSVYSTVELSGILTNLNGGFGTAFFAKKRIADENAGFALVDNNGKAVQFLSYNVVIKAQSGPAAGLESEVLPVSEGFFTSSSKSVQLVGKGSYYEDFKWVIQTQSRGNVNKGQTFVPLRPNRLPGAPSAEPINQPSGSVPPDASVPATAPVSETDKGNVYVDILVDQNRSYHNTSKYGGEMLIVRRAQEFFIDITGSSVTSHNYKVLLTIYPEEQGIEINVGQDKPQDTKGYSAYFVKKSEIVSRVSIFTPPNTPIGQYTIYVQSDTAKVSQTPQPLYIIFNPWSKLDSVYMENDDWRQEYVLNEQGLIWRGSADNNRPVAWNFAQFQTKSLLSAIRLLSQIDLSDRGDPITVSRKMTVLENDCVLYGNWSGNYKGGNPPTSWTGSKDILNQFYQTQQPVKWGQCWVFSGTLTSLMRTLGIPTRSVTNFESAHDSNANRKIDKYFKSNGRQDSDKTSDSIWNFHVWNDAWMTRPDLKEEKFNGWQAIDATPQEKSDNQYQCGPCPLAAIKEGIKVDFDWTFIYAEVNADIYNYVETSGGDYKQVSVQTDCVGYNMSTKAVGRMDRDDVTYQYKYPEGTKEERASFNALENQTEQGISAQLLIPQVKTGETIVVTLRLKSNKNTENDIPVKVVVTGTIVYYNGKTGDELVNATKSFNLPANGEERDLKIDIKEEIYQKYLSNNHEINFRGFVYINSDKEVDALVSKRFTFIDPEPEIKIPEKISRHEKGSVEVSFTNPLSIPLTHVEFAIEGSGVISKQRSSLKSIGPGEQSSVSFSLKDEKSTGNKVVKAQVSSSELETVFSFKEVTVV